MIFQQFNFWKSPSFVSHPADLMVTPEKLHYFSELMASKNIKYESFIENVEALLEVESSKRTHVSVLNSNNFIIFMRFQSFAVHSL